MIPNGTAISSASSVAVPSSSSVRGSRCPSSEATEPSAEDNKATVLRHLTQALNGRQPDVWDEVMDDDFVIVDPNDGRVLLHRIHEGGPIEAMRFSPDGRRLVTAGKSGSVRLWDADDGRLLRSFESHSGEVFAVAWHPAFTEFSGKEMQRRFLRLARRNMTELDYEAWLGVRIFGEAMLRTNATDPKSLRESYDAFKVVVDRFPNSKYAPDAAQRMRYIVNALASHEVHAADYYYRRGAYVAAINRAQLAIKDYKNAPAIEDALHIMMLSYQKLNQPQLADDTKRILAGTFPDSPYITGHARPGTEKSWWQF